ncbi:MAG: flagellar type III secretion system protein FlhB [Burkholderiaceae bacterium]|nr:flagellar type III secretion system protein FlhB [Burkholderiaceae bacterium]
MADTDNAQEKTLEPSAKRLEDARREGQVPRSRDLAHLLLLGSAAGLLFAMSGPLMDAGKRLIARGLTFDAATVADPARMTGRLGELFASSFLALAPVLAVLLVAAIAAPLAIGGFVFAPQMAAPKFDRIDPLKGIGRLFSAPALVELAKVMLVAVLLGTVGGAFVYSHLEEFASLAHEALPTGLAHFGGLLAAAFALLVATLANSTMREIDVPKIEILHHLASQLKMTLEEVKKEGKEYRGRSARSRRAFRQQQREVARRRMMSEIPTADVVVTNPTHYAVALKYSEGKMRAPRVVAKGADAVAARIRELAAEHKVPLLEAPPLARALFRHTELGDEIPATLYAAVAEVLAYVFQLRHYQQVGGAYPDAPTALPVPPELDPLQAGAGAHA